MRLKFLFLLIVLIGSLWLSSCLDNHSHDTDDDPADFAIQGAFTNTNSNFSSGATVIAHSQTEIQNVLESPNAISLLESKKVIADHEGWFSLESLKRGKYFIEAHHGDSVGTLELAEIKPSDILIHVSGILKKYGGIQGQLDVSSLNGKVEIFISELKKRIDINPDGSFDAPSLPPFSYNLRVLVEGKIITHTLNNFSVLVETGQINDLGNIN